VHIVIDRSIGLIGFVNPIHVVPVTEYTLYTRI